MNEQYMNGNFDQGSNATNTSDDEVHFRIKTDSSSGISESSPQVPPTFPGEPLVSLTQTGSAVAIILALTFLIKSLAELLRVAQD